MITIVVAEDQAMILGALSQLLALEPDLTVVGQASDGASALAMVRDLAPDILVSDIEMPNLSGLDVAAALHAERAATKVLIVTTFARAGYLRRAMDAGVRGYLLKDAPAAELAGAVRKIATGERVVAPELAAAAWSEPDPLNDRERQVLRLAEQGKSAKDMARTLSISPGTVRNYLSEASQKLGVNNRIEAARIARAKGWL